jgi:putative flavoprotein involved in K+ transport
MTELTEQFIPERGVCVSAWLAAFGDRLRHGDHQGAAALFLRDGYWRDLLAFTRHIRTMAGTEEIAATLERTLARARPEGFRVDPARTAPRDVTRAGTRTLESIVAFDTALGPASGVLRLVPDSRGPGGMRAWTLMTALDELAGHEEAVGARRPGGEDYSRDFAGDNWLDLREKACAYADREPAVVVVGAGQAGLAIAARLRARGVDTLVIDRHARIGDSWRKRYHALTLHNQVHVNHFPFMPFPPTFPVYIPKDMLANWFEFYAEAMELNVWTGTELAGGSYDEVAGAWRIAVHRSDGTQRVLRPRHVVFAVGVSSIPVRPELAGLDSFAGTVMHSGAYTDGGEWAGRKALVVGTGNSGHDVAHDLSASGAAVTLVQRSPTYVISIEEANKAYGLYDEGPPIEDCDLLVTASPYPVLLRTCQMLTAESRQADQALRDALSARGFRLHDGPDDSGHFMLYLRRGGGYYFNVGASDMIADGRIDVLQFADIERFVAEGARLKNGSVRSADLIVLATGYLNQGDVVRAHLGDDIAQRIGPVWGYGEDGELRNMWRRTAQPGLWFTAGSLAQSRIYSKYLAMQIKACEEGLLSRSLDTDAAQSEGPARSAHPYQGGPVSVDASL